EPEVSGAEAGAGRVTDRSANSADHGGRLPIDHRIHYIRSVIGQQIFAAEPVELNVTDAIGAANNRLWIHAVCQADAGSPIVRVWVNQRAIIQAPALGEKHRVGRWVEVRKMIVTLPLRRGELVADSKIERQLLIDFKIVLHITEVHTLAQMRNRIIVLFVVIAQAEHEIGKTVKLLPGAIQRLAGSIREKPGVIVDSVFRMEIADCRVDHLVFKTDLYAMAPKNFGEVDLGVKDDWILILWIAALPAELRKAAA